MAACADRDPRGSEHRPDRLALLVRRDSPSTSSSTEPLLVVKNGVLTDEVIHIDANQEEDLKIAQANTPVDAKGKLQGDEILAARRPGST